MNKALTLKIGSLFLLLSLAGAGCDTSPVNPSTDTTIPEQTDGQPVTTTEQVVTSTASTPTPTPTNSKPTPAPVSARATYYGVSGVDKVGSVTTGYLATSKVYKIGRAHV